MKLCNKLYIGFRKHVPQEKTTEFDNLFFSKKNPSHKFMIELINSYVDVEEKIKNLDDEEDIKLFAFFLNDYSEKHKPLNKYLSKVAQMPITADVKFLFKDPIK